MAFSLGIVLVIFGLRAGEDSRYDLELPELARGTALFTVLTVIAALAFLGSLRQRVWQRWPLLGLVLGVALVGMYYWPD